MKTISLWWRCAAFAAAFAGVAAAQPSVERIPIPLTDPSRPVMLKVGLIAGGITVKGYAGKEVIVEATMQPDDEDEPAEKPKGTLKRIPNTSMGLTAEEEDNTVSVSTGLMGGSRRIDLSIQVPVACSMKISTVNDGDISVENVNGDLEVNNTNGSISLQKIGGSAVAQTVNGEVHVTFTSVNPGKAMSFSSLNGDIDVTFPASLKANVQLKSEQGEIYSDFDVQMQKSTARVEKNEKGKGTYRVSLEKAMRGTINGGGQEIQFTNFNGSIYIRKGS
ncbi:MAG TPA: DUF4097 family beta strand repeat-containing protein [Bacteroidota bacterium]|nr:DUF4097 family beta strand repeat-containing protein [Bacteroidota bacterium]